MAAAKERRTTVDPKSQRLLVEEGFGMIYPYRWLLEPQAHRRHILK